MINKEELVNMSGEKNVRQSGRYTVPIISLQGSIGIFQKRFPNKETGEWETEDIKGKSIKGVFLKVRRRLFQFKADPSGKSTGETLFSNEHDSWSDKVAILESTKSGKTMKVDEGYYEQIREKYQGLKVHMHIYMLVDDEVIKLMVKGSSLSNLFRYLKEDISSDEHSFEYVTKLTMIENESSLGKYFSIDFVKGEKSDLEVVGPKMKEVHSAVEQSTFKRDDEDEEKKEDSAKDQEAPPASAYEDEEVKDEEEIERLIIEE